MKRNFNKFQLEEMIHHDEVAKIYANRNETDYIWEVPAERYIFKNPYVRDGILLVDMGCGPAIFIKRMLSKNHFKKIKYIGVDISKEMLKIAKKQIPYGVFMQADMEKVNVKEKTVDTILSLGALHHSANKEKTLKNWASLLKKGGYILLREPTKASLRRGYGESPNEEGVDVDFIINFAMKDNLKIEKIVFFWSPVFHFLNRVSIKIGLGEWRRKKWIWRVVLMLDVYLINFLKKITSILNGDSVIIVLKKL